MQPLWIEIGAESSQRRWKMKMMHQRCDRLETQGSQSLAIELTKKFKNQEN